MFNLVVFTMYNAWTVIFSIPKDKRNACDPFLLTEPSARGTIGDEDPFSTAFAKALASDALKHPDPQYAIVCNEPSTNSSDTSEITFCQPSIQVSPFTPRLESSMLCRSEVEKSGKERQQLQTFDPDFICWANDDGSTIPPRAFRTGQVAVAPKAIDCPATIIHKGVSEREIEGLVAKSPALHSTTYGKTGPNNGTEHKVASKVKTARKEGKRLLFQTSVGSP